MAKKKEAPSKMLTPVELELMTVLWSKGASTVHEVLKALPAERNLAYTSVSTVLRILEQKKVVESHKEGRGHVYAPLVAKTAYESLTVQHMVDRVFDGAPASLVRRLLETSDLSREDLLQLQTVLKDKLG